MIWLMVDLVKDLLTLIMKVLHFIFENVNVSFISCFILLTVSILEVNYQPASLFLIPIFFVCTVADLKAQAKKNSAIESVMAQVFFICINMFFMLIAIIFFYSMVKAGFMSGDERPAKYMFKNIETLIVPTLSSEHPFVDFLMILSYLLWLGVVSTCICMQPKVKEKSISDRLFEDYINQTKSSSMMNINKSQFSIKRGSRKGYLIR